MNVYQVTLSGFDGSTDLTDNKIIWVVAEEPEVVTDLLDKLGVKGYDIGPTDLDPSVAGIDFIIPDKPEIKEGNEGLTLVDISMRLEQDLKEFCERYNPDIRSDILHDYGCRLFGKFDMFRDIVPQDIIPIRLPANFEDVRDKLADYDHLSESE